MEFCDLASDDMNTIVFPGMHGNAVLLEDFHRTAPVAFRLDLQTLPRKGWDYEQLTDHFSPVVANLSECMLVGESFSGPLVVKLAARFPKIVKRLLLVASFVTPPTPFAARLLPWWLLFRLPVSDSTVEHWMIGKGHSDQFRQHVRKQVGTADSATMAKRMRQIIRVDVTAELQSLQCPVLYIQAAQDRMVPEQCGRWIAEHSQNASVVRLDGTHLILQTHANEAWDAIRAWVNQR